MAKRRRSCTVMQRVVLQQGAALYCVVRYLLRCSRSFTAASTTFARDYWQRQSGQRAPLWPTSAPGLVPPLPHLRRDSSFRAVSACPRERETEAHVYSDHRHRCVFFKVASIATQSDWVPGYHPRSERRSLPLRGRARPCHICTRSGLTPTTYARDLGSPMPHMHEIWAHPYHICTRSGPTYATRRLGAGVPRKARTAANHLYDCVHGQYATSCANRTGVFY
jgi:hypothetical protein